MRHHSTTGYSFVKKPVTFDKNTDKKLLQYCLGATLYMPGTRHIYDKIASKSLHNITSIVMCFEDAIQESDLGSAEENVLQHLDQIADSIRSKELVIGDIPLIFVRVRNYNQFVAFSKRVNKDRAKVLSGFVFPKFHSGNAEQYLSVVKGLSDQHSENLYSMPILEGNAIAYIESRKDELVSLKQVVDKYSSQILNIRVGGTDFSSLFGVRRGINYTIYDILTVRDCLSDILNFFNRSYDDYLVSAPVWEYFLADKDESINHYLDEDMHRSLVNRTPIINEAIDGLLREVVIDKANGFVGKTIIHPSHAKIVNAMQCVTNEEYEDALQVTCTEGGVIKSQKSNKMNEINPHRSWAEKILFRAQAYGVIEDEFSYLKLISF